ncbi:putative dna replication regulator sld2 protein [Echria macrotheca]|uniref:DNA replication regulator SLD2 n=1 Tax=Echria macrotheca TaxID=438768 RepID=A0AAJ0B7R4_9PEZI|nr:putative dna replication regulator sld2 protein [Echria macrotheca]
MDAEKKAKYEAQSQELRVQLKTWENDWAKAHGGNKPSRNDIKQNPDIAQKYKNYNKIRDILSGKTAPQKDRKRKQPELPELPPMTPSKRPRTAHTPRKTPGQILPADLPGPPAAITTPSISRTLFSPAIPTSIGPTPQRDGRVLGLFDLLGQTPSRSTSETHATPRKGNAAAAVPLGRTPVTGGRFIQLAGLTTPLNERGSKGNTQRTPSSSGTVSKLQFATPAFLRRKTAAPMPVVDENGEWADAVAPLRLPKKPIVRSLSNMVAGLRRMEEEAFEEEMDVMREMEMEATGGGVKKKTLVLEGGKLEVRDSQAVATDKELERQDKPVLLGGFDDENAYDSSEAEQMDRGQPLRVYKKKGQKRTTRKSNLKPTRTKRPSGVEGDQGGDEDDVVHETQFDAAKERRGDLLDELASGSDFDGASSDEEEDDKKKRKGNAAGKGKAAAKKEKGKEKEKEGVVKKAVRKVKATAHANFKRLKLRNYGAKGGPAHNSRFKRRR